MDIERLRALEKAVELVAKATPGPWTTDGGRYVVHDSRHQVCCGRGRYECCGDPDVAGDYFPICAVDDRGGSEHDPDAIIAAVNFIREHGSALIAELGQEVGAVPNGKLVGWWNGITPGFDGMGVPSIRWGADAENSGHDIPLYDGYNPIHYVTPPFSPAHTSEARDAKDAARYRWLKENCEVNGPEWVVWLGDEECIQLDDRVDAAMRQEGGSDD